MQVRALPQVTVDATMLRSAEADVTSSSEEKLSDRFSAACLLSVVLRPWSHPYGPGELEFPGVMEVRRGGRTAS